MHGNDYSHISFLSFFLFLSLSFSLHDVTELIMTELTHIYTHNSGRTKPIGLTNRSNHFSFSSHVSVTISRYLLAPHTHSMIIWLQWLWERSPTDGDQTCQMRTFAWRWALGWGLALPGSFLSVLPGTLPEFNESNQFNLFLFFFSFWHGEGYQSVCDKICDLELSFSCAFGIRDYQRQDTDGRAYRLTPTEFIPIPLSPPSLKTYCKSHKILSKKKQKKNTPSANLLEHWNGFPGIHQSRTSGHSNNTWQKK